MNAKTLAPARRQPGAAVLIFLASACALTDAAALLMLVGWDRFTLGYHEVGHLGASGIEVLQLPKLLLAWGFLAWLLTLALLIYRVARKRKPSPGGAIRLGLTLAALTLLTPFSLGPTVTHYRGPGLSTELSFSNPVFPVIGYTLESTRESDPADTEPGRSEFLCPKSRRWKFLGVTLTRKFYPLLDSEHGARLLKTHCTALVESEKAPGP